MPVYLIYFIKLNNSYKKERKIINYSEQTYIYNILGQS